jgi:hypothetical protein
LPAGKSEHSDREKHRNCNLHIRSGYVIEP